MSVGMPLTIDNCRAAIKRLTLFDLATDAFTIGRQLLGTLNPRIVETVARQLNAGRDKVG
jgi:hypothetical protein